MKLHKNEISTKHSRELSSICDEIEAMQSHRGRYNHYSSDLRKRILKLMEEGVNTATFVKRCGICRSTLHLWKKQQGSIGNTNSSPLTGVRELLVLDNKPSPKKKFSAPLVLSLMINGWRLEISQVHDEDK